MVLQDHSLHGETLLLTSSNVLVRAPTVSFPKATAATKCIKALKVGMLRKEWSKGLGVIWYKQEKTILSQNPCYQCIAKKVITRAVRGHLEYSMPYWWDIKLFHRCFIPYNIYSQYCADKCLPTDPLREKKKIMCSDGQFLWCKFSYHGWFQAINGASPNMEMGRSVHTFI